MALHVESVTREFRNPSAKILKGISFVVQSGEFLSLTGRSGSGKSTLLYIMGSLDLPTEGDVRVDELSFRSMEEKELHRFRNNHIGFVFQFHYLLPELTALENVLLPARKRGDHESPHRRGLALSLLEEFDLSDRIHSRPYQLSGGERQRVAVARALIMEPDFLFADEPTGNLDSKNAERVLSIFQRINTEKRTTIVMVTHSDRDSHYAHRIINLFDGQIATESRNKMAEFRL